MRWSIHSENLFRLSIFLLLFALPSRAEPPIPDEWKEYVRLDQSYNFNRGDFYPVPADKRAPVPIYHLDIPLRDAEIQDSEFIDAGTEKWAYVEKAGQRFARVYFYDPESAALKRLEREHKQKAAQEFWGVRLQSHNTHLVWNPRTQDAAFIKMGSGDGDLWSRNVPSTIQINDYVEKIMAENAGVELAILPERHGIVVGGIEDGQANLIRAAKPIGTPPKEGAELVPSHGFLNSPLLEEAAKAMGMDRLTYLKTYYAPRLAEHYADLNFKLGLYPEAHTQNTLLWLDRKTGRIEGFVHRDLTDMAIDPAIEHKKNGDKHLAKLKRLNVSRLNRHHVGFDKSHLELDWAFGNAWIMQYIHEHFWSQDRTEDPQLIRAFILAYVEAAEKSSGIKLDRSKLGEVEMYPNQFGGKWQYQNIYKQVIAALYPPIDLGSATKAKHDQFQMLQLFLENYDRGSTAILDPAFRLELANYREATKRGEKKAPPFRFHYRDAQLFAYEPETGRILAMTYRLDNDDRWPYETLKFKARCFVLRWIGGT